MAVLEKEIQAFESQKQDLFSHYLNKFVVFYENELVGHYDTLDAAAQFAISKYGKGPFLIRQVKEEQPIVLPASVAFQIIK